MTPSQESESSAGPAVRFPMLAGLVVVLGALLLWNPWSAPSASTVPVDVSLKETVYLTARSLDAEYQEMGQYPATLEEVGMDEDGLTYRITGDGYQLVAEAEGVRVEYRSGEDLSPFREAFEALLPPFGDAR